MLKDSPIVILDEATSALDNKSEAIVQKALDNLMQNKTVFVIAHRLSTIKNADVIEDTADDDVISVNKTVTLYFEEDGEEDVFSIVTTVLVDSLQNRVSIESPIGKALQGHRVGDRVYIPVNADYGYYVTVKKIEIFEEDVPLNSF